MAETNTQWGELADKQVTGKHCQNRTGALTIWHTRSKSLLSIRRISRKWGASLPNWRVVSGCLERRKATRQTRLETEKGCRGWCKWDNKVSELAQLLLSLTSNSTSIFLFSYCFIACSDRSLFHLMLPFSHFYLCFVFSLSFFNIAHPPPASLPEALSLELPRFFIKELRLKPLNYYGGRGREEGTRGEGNKVCFSLFHSHLCPLHPFTHVSLSPYTLKIKRHMVF